MAGPPAEGGSITETTAGRYGASPSTEESIELSDHQFMALAARLGLSPADPMDGWRLAELLFAAFPKPGNVPGVKADPNDTVDDVILCYGVHAATAKGAKGGLRVVIRAIAEANGWPADEISIETKRRRYYQLRGTLARDNAAAREAARQAELDAAKQTLRAEAAAYLSDYAALVRNLRSAASGIATLEARMREISAWCGHLSPNGKAPMICDRQAHEKRLAYLVAHAMRRNPGHRERLGDLAWPAFADAEHPVGLDPVEIEGDRLQRHIVDALARVSSAARWRASR